MDRWRKETLSFQRKLPSEQFVQQVIMEGDPLDLASLLEDKGEYFIVASSDGLDIGVVRLSTPYGQHIPHVSFSDSYVLKPFRGAGIYKLLLKAALDSPPVHWAIANGGPVYTHPILGKRQKKTLSKMGFHTATQKDYSTWPFIDPIKDLMFYRK